MVILYNYLEEGTIKIGVFCCRAPRRGLRIEIAATQISVFRLCVKLRVGACGLKYIRDKNSLPVCRVGLRVGACGLKSASV